MRGARRRCTESAISVLLRGLFEVMTAVMPAVVTHALRKSYGPIEVLHGIDLCVPDGALYGFLGPNGAGKSTTLRILLGLLRGTGTVRVLNQDPWHSGAALRAEVGYLPGDVRWYPRLTGRQTLRFFDQVRRRDSRRAAERLAELFELDLGRRVRDYSRGMKQKLGLIQALMHEPRLLVLDEPTTGLDPLVQQTLHGELRRIIGTGRTVLFSSHTLSEVELLCDWVAVVRAGRLVEETRIDALRARALRHVQIVFAADSALPTAFPAGLSARQTDGRSLQGTWTGPMEELLAWLAAQRVSDVTIAPPDLEDLFRAFYAEPAGEGSA